MSDITVILNTNEVVKEIFIDKVDIGILIGFQGVNLKMLEDCTGAKISLKGISDHELQKYQLVISGNEFAVKKSQNLIDEILNEKLNHISEAFYAEEDFCNKLIVQQNKILIEVSRLSKTQLKVDLVSKIGGNYCPIIITGSPANIQSAKYLLLKRMDEFQITKEITKTLLGNELFTLIFVSAVETPEHFWVQFFDPKNNQLDILMKNMHDFYHNLNDQNQFSLQEEFVKLGDMYAVDLEGDGNWYRVMITDVYPTEVDVYCVDYGNSVILPFHKLRLLKSEFLNLPFQATECLLSNIKSYDGDWSEEAISTFESLVQVGNWHPLMCKIIGYQQTMFGTLPALIIIDTNDNKNINIGLKLIELNFAKNSVFAPNVKTKTRYKPRFPDIQISKISEKKFIKSDNIIIEQSKSTLSSLINYNSMKEKSSLSSHVKKNSKKPVKATQKCNSTNNKNIDLDIVQISQSLITDNDKFFHLYYGFCDEEDKYCNVNDNDDINDNNPHLNKLEQNKLINIDIIEQSVKKDCISNEGIYMNFDKLNNQRYYNLKTENNIKKKITNDIENNPLKRKLDTKYQLSKVSDNITYKTTDYNFLKEDIDNSSFANTYTDVVSESTSLKSLNLNTSHVKVCSLSNTKINVPNNDTLDIKWDLTNIQTKNIECDNTSNSTSSITKIEEKGIEKKSYNGIQEINKNIPNKKLDLPIKTKENVSAVKPLSKVTNFEDFPCLKEMKMLNGVIEDFSKSNKSLDVITENCLFNKIILNTNDNINENVKEIKREYISKSSLPISHNEIDVLKNHEYKVQTNINLFTDFPSIEQLVNANNVLISSTKENKDNELSNEYPCLNDLISINQSYKNAIQNDDIQDKIANESVLKVITPINYKNKILLEDKEKTLIITNMENKKHNNLNELKHIKVNKQYIKPTSKSMISTIEKNGLESIINTNNVMVDKLDMGFHIYHDGREVLKKLENGDIKLKNNYISQLDVDEVCKIIQGNSNLPQKMFSHIKNKPKLSKSDIKIESKKLDTHIHYKEPKLFFQSLLQRFDEDIYPSKILDNHNEDLKDFITVKSRKRNNKHLNSEGYVDLEYKEDEIFNSQSILESNKENISVYNIDSGKNPLDLSIDELVNYIEGNKDKGAVIICKGNKNKHQPIINSDTHKRKLVVPSYTLCDMKFHNLMMNPIDLTCYSDDENQDDFTKVRSKRNKRFKNENSLDIYNSSLKESNDGINEVINYNLNNEYMPILEKSSDPLLNYLRYDFESIVNHRQSLLIYNKVERGKTFKKLSYIGNLDIETILRILNQDKDNNKVVNNKYNADLRQHKKDLQKSPPYKEHKVEHQYSIPHLTFENLKQRYDEDFYPTQDLDQDLNANDFKVIKSKRRPRSLRNLSDSFDSKINIEENLYIPLETQDFMNEELLNLTVDDLVLFIEGNNRKDKDTFNKDQGNLLNNTCLKRTVEINKQFKSAKIECELNNKEKNKYEPIRDISLSHPHIDKSDLQLVNVYNFGLQILDKIEAGKINKGHCYLSSLDVDTIANYIGNIDTPLTIHSHQKKIAKKQDKYSSKLDCTAPLIRAYILPKLTLQNLILLGDDDLYPFHIDESVELDESGFSEVHYRRKRSRLISNVDDNRDYQFCENNSLNSVGAPEFINSPSLQEDLNIRLPVVDNEEKLLESISKEVDQLKDNSCQYVDNLSNIKKELDSITKSIDTLTTKDNDFINRVRNCKAINDDLFNCSNFVATENVAQTITSFTNKISGNEFLEKPTFLVEMNKNDLYVGNENITKNGYDLINPKLDAIKVQDNCVNKAKQKPLKYEIDSIEMFINDSNVLPMSTIANKSELKESDVESHNFNKASESKLKIIGVPFKQDINVSKTNIEKELEIKLNKLEIGEAQGNNYSKNPESSLDNLVEFIENYFTEDVTIKPDLDTSIAPTKSISKDTHLLKDISCSIELFNVQTMDDKNNEKNISKDVEKEEYLEKKVHNLKESMNASLNEEKQTKGKKNIDLTTINFTFEKAMDDKNNDKSVQKESKKEKCPVKKVINKIESKHALLDEDKPTKELIKAESAINSTFIEDHNNRKNISEKIEREKYPEKKILNSFESINAVPKVKNQNKEKKRNELSTNSLSNEKTIDSKNYEKTITKDFEKNIFNEKNILDSIESNNIVLIDENQDIVKNTETSINSKINEKSINVKKNKKHIPSNIEKAKCSINTIKSKDEIFKENLQSNEEKKTAIPINSPINDQTIVVKNNEKPISKSIEMEKYPEKSDLNSIKSTNVVLDEEKHSKEKNKNATSKNTDKNVKENKQSKIDNKDLTLNLYINNKNLESVKLEDKEHKHLQYLNVKDKSINITNANDNKIANSQTDEIVSKSVKDVFQPCNEFQHTITPNININLESTMRKRVTPLNEELPTINKKMNDNKIIASSPIPIEIEENKLIKENSITKVSVSNIKNPIESMLKSSSTKTEINGVIVHEKNIDDSFVKMSISEAKTDNSINVTPSSKRKRKHNKIITANSMETSNENLPTIDDKNLNPFIDKNRKAIDSKNMLVANRIWTDRNNLDLESSFENINNKYMTGLNIKTKKGKSQKPNFVNNFEKSDNKSANENKLPVNDENMKKKENKKVKGSLRNSGRSSLSQLNQSIDNLNCPQINIGNNKGPQNIKGILPTHDLSTMTQLSQSLDLNLDRQEPQKKI